MDRRRPCCGLQRVRRDIGRHLDLAGAAIHDHDRGRRSGFLWINISKQAIHRTHEIQAGTGPDLAAWTWHRQSYNCRRRRRRPLTQEDELLGGRDVDSRLTIKSGLRRPRSIDARAACSLAWPVVTEGSTAL